MGDQEAEAIKFMRLKRSDLDCFRKRFLTSEKIENSLNRMDRAEPQNWQKPMAKSDQNYMEGPSYSTRSKVNKRTSHSENDSSRSQSHQPPLKRQARQDPKQADIPVEINIDTTPDADQIDTNIVDEVTSAEIALQNELILESLLKYLNRSDLVSCRVVNKKWQNAATKELGRRKLIIKFSFRSHENRVRPKRVFQNICRVISECRTPSLFSSFQVETDSRNDLESAGLRSIFTAVGHQLKDLTLHLNYMRNQGSFERSSLMTDLQNLLCRQTPNLQSLEIEFEFPDHWKKELQTWEPSAQPQNDNNEFQLLPNLKTFIVTGTPPPKFIVDVINAAVNLRSLGGVLSWEVSALFKYFIRDVGKNKIHLLKALRIHLSRYRLGLNAFDFYIELMETLLTEHKQNLQLETFECVSKFFGDSSPLEPRFINVINQILECSSGSLRKLRIEPVFEFSVLVIPHLPKLQEICFDCHWLRLSWPYHYFNFFPRGFNMNLVFPNVSSIVFSECSATVFRQFIRSIENAAEPITSVRHIIMDGNKSSFHLLASDFRHVFPNLSSISYCEDEKYYKI